MKTPPSSAPRFVCRLTRLLRSLSGNADAPGTGHVLRCTECQRYFAATATLELQLRRESLPFAVALPGKLEERVLRAVTRSARVEKPSRAPALRRAGFALATVAAIAAVWMRRDPPQDSTPAMVADLIAVSEALPRLNLVLPAAEALAAKNPLQSELDAVYSDARFAVRFLALNFLPTQPADAVSPPAARDKG